ncbi:MAG: immunoglobulin domain-containing protein [Verrucomicrobia bacterium]|nr:immunoglobulin domain-containing protein [Verrucomicrobiota bacterium]
MKFPAALRRRLHWLNFPGALLVAFLQRAPVLRTAAGAAEGGLIAPAGAILRAAFATTASLGALHTLAGATQVVVTATSVNVPVDTPITPVSFVTTGAPTIALSYRITGLPPGLTVPGFNTATGILNISNPTGSGQITGTPTIAGSYPVTLQAWEFSNATGSFSQTITVLFTVSAASATGQPRITAQPASVVTVVGQSVTFSVGVTANPAATYQWFKEGIPIAGANGASFTIADAKLSDAANYRVNVTNTFGTVQSAAATLTVNAAATPPVFTAHPQAVTVATGATIVLSGTAAAVPTPLYQWWLGAKPVAGATQPTLVLTGAAAVAGSYTLVATNDVSFTTSNAAVVTITNTANPGRLINLSILTALTAGETMTMGAAVGGAGTAGTRAVLARAAGPSLAQLGVGNVLPDPRLTVVVQGSGAVIAQNNDWGSDASLLAATFSQVGAFPYTSSQSRDAAILLQALSAGNYTFQVSDNSPAAAGTAIAELYDAGSLSAGPAPAPRLINVSVLKQIAPAGSLTAGFYVGGDTAKTVLIRAIGPGLTPLGVGGTMPDPRLALNRGSTKIAENDDWGGGAQLTTVAKSVGAFAIDDTASRDAMLLATLAPGSYNAVVSPANTGGIALVEIYEVP